MFNLTKMFGKEEIESSKLVTLYSLWTSIYFTLLILILFWTDGIYLVGKYHFNSVIFIVVFIEIAKYFVGVFCVRNYDNNLSKKYNETSSSFLKNMFSKTKIKEGVKNVIVVCLMTLLYGILAILYGAEMFSKHEETFMFSFLLSVLTVLPACINLGSQSVISLVLGSKPINKLDNLIHQNFFFTLIGAWLGAFVIPLDWDRPWQKWPIPCSCGAMIGFALSHFVIMFKVQTIYRKKTKQPYY